MREFKQPPRIGFELTSPRILVWELYISMVRRWILGRFTFLEPGANGTNWTRQNVADPPMADLTQGQSALKGKKNT